MKIDWESERPKLQMLLSQRKSIKTIADQYGVSPRTMTKALRRLELRALLYKKLSDDVKVGTKFAPKWDFSGDNLDLKYR